ncbi:ABC transporter ATP-binding protein [Cellulosilyticum sp. I15G10I2]|uniref:ABC transporter ATP-binding protein n=1 Tax=Cellulosilyticum sp. I15G10I2 TaxID=1892843 RepID=UPI00085BC4B4|nr:ABC transporter ATP-binding protein [Cellulosilyticum sp. I15G10I2]
MIKVEKLFFAYPRMKEDVLKDLNFEVGEGEIFGLLGPSGAGKSTLQKILLGLLKGYRGSAKVMGKEVSAMETTYYDKIGVGFELPNLYEQLTVLENMQTFSKLYTKPASIESLLRDVGLYEHKTKKVSQISKGMKMRLNFCRALIGTPEILFLDEPTSGLDPNNIEVIRKLVLKQKELGRTIILTTHNMSFAEEVCDRVGFVVEGEIKKIGTPAFLKYEYGENKVCVRTTDRIQEFEMKGIDQNKLFLEAIKHSDLKQIYTKQPSLEEIFSIVTGRVLI